MGCSVHGDAASDLHAEPFHRVGQWDARTDPTRSARYCWLDVTVTDTSVTPSGRSSAPARTPDPRFRVRTAPAVQPAGVAESNASAGAGLPGGGFARSGSWRIAALVYLIFILLPGFYSPLVQGPDAGWVYAFNALVHTSLIFGRDVVFTYGPFAFLIVPIDIGQNLWLGQLFRLGVHVVFGVFVSHFILGARSLAQIVLFVVGYATAAACNLPYESHLMLVFGMLLVTALERRGFTVLGFGLAGVLASFLMTIKLSLAILGLAMVSMSMLYATVVNRRMSWGIIVPSTIGFLSMSTVLIVVHFQTIENAVSWIRLSLEIASSYDTVMSLIGPQYLVVMGMMMTVLYVIITACTFSLQSRHFRTACIFFVPMMLIFKHGFIRQDGHEVFFFPAVLCVASLLVLRAERRREIVLSLVLFVFALPMVIVSDIQYNRFQTASFVNIFGGAQAASNIRSLARLDDTKARLASASSQILSVERLPSSWLNRIRSAEGDVDVAPFELTYIYVNGLTWRPSPTIQTYVAWTAHLDSWNARHYASSSAPDFIVLHYAGVDGRHPLLSSPATAREIIRNYERVEENLASRLVLLQRRQVPLADGLTPLQRASLRIGEWVDVPISDRPVFARFDMELELAGRLLKTAFRIDPVQMEFRYASGKLATFRVYPDALKNGMLVNLMPGDTGGLADLFGCLGGDRVTQFRIVGDGAGHYREPVDVTWEEAPWNLHRATGQDGSAVSGLACWVSPPQGALTTVGGKFSLDRVNDNMSPATQSTVDVDPASEPVLTFAGWTFVDGGAPSTETVLVEVDGQVKARGDYGVERADLVTVFGGEQYRHTGFHAALPTTDLGPGTHTVRFRVMSTEGDDEYRPDFTLVLRVK